MPVSYYGDLSGESSSDDSEGSSEDDEFESSSWHERVGRARRASPTRIIAHDTIQPSSSSSFSASQSDTRRTTSQHDLNNITSDNNLPSLEHLWSRCILHLDIDCFYCQCEEIDRKLEEPRRPLAIGQKHIIVTCNYEARKYGVKKLQSRESALAACPHLLIVEGSDLLRYKRYSRKVYESFRLALQELANEIGISIIPAKKGCMDEMMADLTGVVNHMLQEGIIPDENTTLTPPTNKQHHDLHQHYRSSFVYGDSNTTVTLVEDQTGQTTTINSSSSPSNTITSSNSTRPDRILLPSRQNVHDGSYHDNSKRTLEQQLCCQRLHLAGRLVARVCKRIVQETGFYTTGGISVSPLLAKLASDLNKPKSANLLYPWRCSPLLYSMPLRKLHGLGYQTMKALDPCLSAAVGSSANENDAKVKTVLDLLQVPNESIAKCLQSLHAYQESGAMEQCELLIQRCRGLDASEIVDDHGGLPKTVSIENSFRRNTVTTQAAVQKGLDDLLHRLPFLLNDRTSWARNPETAYPTTIRVTVRLVDLNLVPKQDGTTITQAQRRKGRRPYVTTSRQSPLTNGKALVLAKDDPNQQSQMLKKWVEPLLEQLLSKAIKTNTINLTRLNIALANFQDTVNTATRNHSSTAPTSHQGVSLSQSFFGVNESSASKRASGSAVEWSTPNTKRAKTETQKPSSMLPRRLSPSTPTPPHRNIQTTQHKPSSFTSMKQKSNRMKATTIDTFFYRKPK